MQKINKVTPKKIQMHGTLLSRRYQLNLHDSDLITTTVRNFLGHKNSKQT